MNHFDSVIMNFLTLVDDNSSRPKVKLVISTGSFSVDFLFAGVMEPAKNGSYSWSAIPDNIAEKSRTKLLGGLAMPTTNLHGYSYKMSISSFGFRILIVWNWSSSLASQLVSIQAIWKKSKSFKFETITKLKGCSYKVKEWKQYLGSFTSLGSIESRIALIVLSSSLTS